MNEENGQIPQRNPSFEPTTIEGEVRSNFSFPPSTIQSEVGRNFSFPPSTIQGGTPLSEGLGRNFSFPPSTIQGGTPLSFPGNGPHLPPLAPPPLPHSGLGWHEENGAIAFPSGPGLPRLSGSQPQLRQPSAPSGPGSPSRPQSGQGWNEVHGAIVFSSDTGWNALPTDTTTPGRPSSTPPRSTLPAIQPSANPGPGWNALPADVGAGPNHAPSTPPPNEPLTNKRGEREERERNFTPVNANFTDVQGHEIHVDTPNTIATNATLYIRHIGEGGHSSFGDFGHVMLEIHDGGQIVGFDYFSKLDSSSSGIIHTYLEPQEKNASIKITIPISGEQAQNMIDHINNLTMNVPAYHLPTSSDPTSTCVTRSLEVLKAGGIDLGNHTLPSEVQNAATQWLAHHQTSSTQ